MKSNEAVVANDENTAAPAASTQAPMAVNSNEPLAVNLNEPRLDMTSFLEAVTSAAIPLWMLLRSAKRSSARQVSDNKKQRSSQCVRRHPAGGAAGGGIVQ